MGYSNFAEYIMAAQTQEFLKKTLGFTLIELLVVMAILGVLATVLLIAINPVEQLAKTRDSGRISGVTQLGRAISAFYTTRNEVYPTPNQWSQELVSAGEFPIFPAGIAYSAYGIINCQANVQPATDPTYCYSLDESGNGFGAIVFTKLESKIQISKCTSVGDAYFVFSTADGRGGIICASGDSFTPVGCYRFTPCIHLGFLFKFFKFCSRMRFLIRCSFLW